MKVRRPYMTEQVYQLVFGVLFYVQPGNTLRCYECSESFPEIWMPLDCQFNVTAVPFRLCNDNQAFCYVASVTVKGILTQITRDCIDECFYGCQASDFGVTTITCTSCCDQDFCNIGNAAAQDSINCFILLIVTLFSIAKKLVLVNLFY